MKKKISSDEPDKDHSDEEKPDKENSYDEISDEENYRKVVTRHIIEDE